VSVIQRHRTRFSIDWPDSLVSLGGRLHVYDNPALTSIDGFESLISVGEGVLIRNNG
jgi:hypothetical protein